MTYTKDNSFFMCHRCLHTFFFKADVKRHLSKQKKCESQYNCLMNDHEIFLKSTNKRFYFPGHEKLPNLEKHHLIKLVSDYYQAINIIPGISFLNKPNNIITSISSKVDNSLLESDKLSATPPLPSKPVRSIKEMMENFIGKSFDCDDDLRCSRLEELRYSLDPKDPKRVDDFPQPLSTDLSGGMSVEPSDESDSLSIDGNCEKMLLLQSLMEFINSKKSDETILALSKVKAKPSFVTEDGSAQNKCKYCERIFTRRDNYIRHIQTSAKCCNNEDYKEMMDKEKGRVNNYNSVYNISNNIQNVQNNGNNHNKIEVKVRDFFGDPFEYIHIPNELVHDKEFFLHQNFIQHLFENDVNKNIYFENKYAFIYTNKGLTRIPSDKAVYLILDKLDSAIGSYLRSNSLINPDDYEFVMRFYSVVTKKFLTDSIHRVYDVEKREFIPFETKNIRTRDKYMSEVIQCLSKIKGRTKELLQLLIENSNGEIDTNYKLNIPFFESALMRNKGFEEKF